jgi:hypothetical protein
MGHMHRLILHWDEKLRGRYWKIHVSQAPIGSDPFLFHIAWDEWSWMQLLAIVLLVASTAAYNLLPQAEPESTANPKALNIQGGSSLDYEDDEKLALLAADLHPEASDSSK